MTYRLFFKTKKHQSLQKVISDTSGDLMTFDKGEEINYSPHTILDDSQCFYIEKIKGEEYFLNFLSSFASASNNQWNNCTDIEYILNTDGNSFYFQKFTSAQIIKNNWFRLLKVSGEPSLQDEDIITINKTAHALYDKKTDTLYFKNLDKIINIFSGIRTLYREATQEEIDNFLNNDLFDMSNYKEEKLGIANRKKIFIMKNQLKNLDDKAKFCKSLKEYCSELDITDNKITINTETDLRNVIHHLNEKFYTTTISNEKRLANSIIPIK